MPNCKHCKKELNNTLIDILLHEEDCSSNPSNQEQPVEGYTVDMTKYPPLKFNRAHYSDKEWEEICKVTVPAEEQFYCWSVIEHGSEECKCKKQCRACKTSTEAPRKKR